ncbi:hypothetical protein AYL99_10627 [Fonsecaea erecta]|uniref:Major facilitator superfamily (MFS) profile domain-containing protein n=1 Tax=Fonsecaea erecta TaxID=1367422 RepID=A0A178Z5A2_9EURO|nr:hypothetical protein AYL99_10627 [Fonsecaea erecta]OAP54927.1 hypothetical protein AYL99_10627 [Fonsecaea erecta]
MSVLKNFNRSLTGAVLLISLSTFNYGFDNQGFATAQAMDSFTRQFGDKNHKTGKYELNNVWLSLFSSLIYIGFSAGIILGSSLNAWVGRRRTMFILSTYEIITATIIVTSQTREQILAGRVLNCKSTFNDVYIGMELAVVPVFQSEIVPTPVRGLAVSTYQFSLIFGGLVMNCICLGTSSISDNRAWRIPLGLFYIIPSIIMASIFTIPESPRWLLIKGREEEALQSLTRLRKGAFSQQEIEREFEAIRLGLIAEPEQGSFTELFQGVNRKRTFIAAGVHFLQNLCGQDIVSKFGSLIVKSLHTISPFVMTVVFAITNLVFVFTGMLTNDKIGRRPLLMLSAAQQMTALLILGGIGHTGWPLAKRYQPVSIVMLVLQTAGFSIGFAPLTNVVTTEIVALRLRDRTQLLACTMNVIANFAVGFSLPYLLNAPYANLHLQIGWVFAPICFIALVFVYFMVPECKGKSMEQIDRMFHEGISIRQFGKYNIADVTEESYVTELAAKSGDVTHVEERER